MRDLPSLLERVEKATGPDRVLEAYLMCALSGYTMHEDSDPGAGVFAFWSGEPWNSICHNCTSWSEATHSIDDALALVKQALPDREWAVGEDRENRRCWATVDDDCWDEAMNRFEGYAKTAPLAILAALLKALIAQRETKVVADGA